MMTEHEIVEYLLYYFDSVYCFNCARQCGENDEYDLCEDCHRKNMQWKLSEDAAQRLAGIIVGGV